MKDPESLIGKILSGDTKAFESLVEAYQRLVSHIVFRMIHRDADREDICQEIFILIYKNLGNFKFESRLSTWIATISYNRCINYLEKKRVPLLDDQSKDEGETSERFSSSETLPDQQIAEQDIAARLQSEIENLPAQFRAILTLYHLDEMKYNEITEITGLPEGTVKSYLFRGRKLLKEKLMAKYRVEELWG